MRRAGPAFQALRQLWSRFLGTWWSWALGIPLWPPRGLRGRSTCLRGLAWRWGTGQLAGLGRAQLWPALRAQPAPGPAPPPLVAPPLKAPPPGGAGAGSGSWRAGSGTPAREAAAGREPQRYQRARGSGVAAVGLEGRTWTGVGSVLCVWDGALAAFAARSFPASLRAPVPSRRVRSVASGSQVPTPTSAWLPRRPVCESANEWMRPPLTSLGGTCDCPCSWLADRRAPLFWGSPSPWVASSLAFAHRPQSRARPGRKHLSHPLAAEIGS